MKKAMARWLSLLLCLAMALSLACPALAAGNETDSDTDSDAPSTSLTLDITKNDGTNLDASAGTSDYQLLLEPNVGNTENGLQLSAGLKPVSTENDAMHIAWTSSDQAVARVNEFQNGHSATIVPVGPGEATITITAGEGTAQVRRTIAVTVSGIKLSEEMAAGVSVKENESVTLTSGTISEGKDFQYFGNATSTSATLTTEIVNNSPNVNVTSADRTQIVVEGVREGRATIRIRLQAGSYSYSVEFPVTVTENVAIIRYTAGASPTEPMKFSTLEQQILRQCQEMTGSALSYVTGLNVSTSQGTLYLGWQSAENTGMGVGSALNYYASSASRGPYLSDVVFVPSASYNGETATITYTGTASNGRTYRGEIVVTIKESSTELTITTKRATPIKLTGTLFNDACQRETGAPLSYVIFTLPPANQGSLYVGYKSELDYASKVTANDQYSRSALDTLTFVPATDYVGTVPIRYFGYNVSGSRYAGELVVKVEQGLDDSIVYYDNSTGRVTFLASDFSQYCQNATGGIFSYATFTPPPTSQGILSYYGWTLTSEQQVASPDYVTFTAASGFDGVVRIPFVGYDRNSRQFKGTVEIHIQSTGESDLSYYCAPGSSVKLVASDFNNLSMAQTGERLHYIAFQSLPDHNMGALYHNRTSSGGIGTRVKKDIKYFQSATPYLSNLSFWATDKFTGTVEIPFTGASISGKTFSGLLTIRSGSGSGAGSSSGVGTNGATISYSTTGREQVLFNGKDFDTACRTATNSALSYVRFSLPSSGQGILYFDYQSTAAPTAVSASTSYYLSGEESISKVSFHPAYGASGLVQIPFSGQAIDGSDFQGVVSINVRASGSSGTNLRYATFGTPVKLSANDFLFAAGTNQPVSVTLDSLPDPAAGKLYYQYVSPTQYSWQANTTTGYSLSGDPLVSNLTFIPKAGYVGMATIPYTATNGDGTTYAGEIRITVNTPASSDQFDDLEGFNGETLAAVGYLYDRGVVNGMGNNKYGPELSIRRGDFCLMLYRAFRFESGGTSMPFSDVPGNSYYANAINVLSSLGVVNGTGNNKFQPDDPISRQDASLMIQRTLKTAGMTVDNGSAEDIASFPDAASVAPYAQGAVTGLVRLGLIPATEDNRLAPTEPLTRASMAVLLHRAMTQ